MGGQADVDFILLRIILNCNSSKLVWQCSKGKSQNIRQMFAHFH